MQVMINGKTEEVIGGSLLDLLKAKNIEPQMVAVEVNDHMVERTQLATTHLKDGDQVEKGDVLFEIDPRPFAAQEQQAEGELARWEAQKKKAGRK